MIHSHFISSNHSTESPYILSLAAHQYLEIALPSKIFSLFYGRTPISGDRFTRHEPFGYTLDPFGHILTRWKSNTGIYKTTYTAQQRLSRSLLQKLMGYEEFDSQGNLIDIDRTHIERIYGPQNSWIYNKWYSNPDFTENLKDLNHLRREIRQKSLGPYLKDNWPVVYNRFWVNQIVNSKSQCDLYFLINELENLGDDALIRSLLSIDLPDLLGRILSDHGFPTYP